MRIALISDIHGNEIALKAVIKDINQVGVDQIICLGDVVTLGPLPCSVLQIIRDLDCSCILGNHDAFMIDPDLIHRYTEAPLIVDAVDWCRSQLSKEDLEFIETFQLSIEIIHDQNNKLLFFHGSPRDHMENILSTTPSNELEQMLGGDSAGVMAGGHTHVQMLRQHKGNLIVNPGSVGLPFKEFVYGRQPEIMKHSEYAILEMEQENVNVALKRVQFNQKDFLKTIDNCKTPVQDLYPRNC